MADTNRKARGRAVMSILKDIDKANAAVAKAVAATARLTELKTELDDVPAERRERELSNAQTAVSLLGSVPGDKDTNTELEESKSS